MNAILHEIDFWDVYKKFSAESTISWQHAVKFSEHLDNDFA